MNKSLPLLLLALLLAIPVAHAECPALSGTFVVAGESDAALIIGTIAPDEIDPVARFEGERHQEGESPTYYPQLELERMVVEPDRGKSCYIYIDTFAQPNALTFKGYFYTKRLARGVLWMDGEMFAAELKRVTF